MTDMEEAIELEQQAAAINANMLDLVTQVQEERRKMEVVKVKLLALTLKVQRAHGQG